MRTVDTRPIAGGMPTVAVIGGGITGLAAAYRVQQLLDHGQGGGGHGGGGGSEEGGRGGRILLFEAGVRPGGQVRTIELGGAALDVGAEALPATPPVLALLNELGLAQDAVSARPGTTWLWTRRGLRALPAGVGPAGPSRLGPVLRAGVLSPAGLARAALEPLLPRTPASADLGVGAFVTARFGRQVTERLVDPLLGNLHAGDVNRLSLRATTPALAAIAAEHRSVVLAHRARTASGGAPEMLSWPGGLATLVYRLDARARAAGVDVRHSSPVVAIEPCAPGYRLVTATGQTARADVVVLAIPAHLAAGLLAPLAPDAAAHLAAVRFASVATIVVAYPRPAADVIAALGGTGLLVPSSAGWTLKAATFLGAKWAHLDDPDRCWVRLSVGRAGDPVVDELDDAALLARAQADLARATGLGAAPVATWLQRWPATLPQLEVGHLDRMAAARLALARHPGLVLAGTSVDGPGLAAGLASGMRAAESIPLAVPVPGGRQR